MIDRDIYLEKLKDRMDDGAIKVITGLRRSGKSTLLFKIFYDYLLSIGVDDKNIIKIDLDSFEHEELHDYKTLGNYIKSLIGDNQHYYILLDEVQFCDHFEKVLNSLNRNENLDIYVTGSNSKFLSTDILTEFRGRGEEIRVLPLSFSEYYNSLDNVEFSQAFNDYITFGGLPRVLSFKKNEQKIEYLTSLFKETYLKDIVERNNLRGEVNLDSLVNVLASSVGSLTSPNKIAKTSSSILGVSVSDKTIKNYIEYLKDAFIINEASRYDIRGREYLSSMQKYYFTDLGLRNARLNFRQIEYTHLMENCIYNELLYRNYNVDVGIVYANELKNGKYVRKATEVDFVCNFGSKKYYIQSAYALPTEEKLNQEARPLLHINDNFKKIIIVREDINPHYNDDGILIMGIKSFLLNINSLDL